jgi:dephospho-CoA kinase
MNVIGLVGGVAAGKSLVANCFARLSAEVLDADAASHAVLRDPDVIREVYHLWGVSMTGSDGQIDRRALARIVFAPPPEGPRQRRKLEQLIHPRVREQFVHRIEQLRRDGSHSAVVIDAPLLLEAGWGQICDHIVFVKADRDTRLARALDRGWSEDEFVIREQSQLPLDKKEASAEIVIDNSGSPEQTYAQVEAFWKRL